MRFVEKVTNRLFEFYVDFVFIFITEDEVIYSYNLREKTNESIDLKSKVETFSVEFKTERGTRKT